MLVGEIFSDWRSSTILVFYSFLPAVIWMIFIRMKRNTKVITELKAQVDRLKESRRSSQLHVDAKTLPKSSPMIYAFVIVALLAAPTVAAAKQPLPTAHTTCKIEGWNVRVDDRLLKGEDSALGARVLKLLEARLVAISVVVPDKSLAKLRTITIQLDLNYGDLRTMQYHPDAGWLKEHGYSEQLAKCVHIPDVNDLLEPAGIHSQPWVLLHELAHGFHDQIVGFDEPRVNAAWEKFRGSGKYKSVLSASGTIHEHYGLTDHKEFFAEMTEAYFGSNDFYPFVAGELKQAEPEIFLLLADIWGPLPGFAQSNTAAHHAPNPPPEVGSENPKVQGLALNVEVEANKVAEITFEAASLHSDPFMQVILDVEFTDPAGAKKLVPAFWAGKNQWKVRYASPIVGVHLWRSICNVADDSGLHGVEGKVTITPNTGTNLLYLHGPVRVAQDKRHFEHADGTPFLWLGDTWWKCLCRRMTWEGFQQLTADRKAKGFNVVQIVCGPYPDEDMMEARWENEGGKPYQKLDFSVMNPAYFDYADRRFQHLIDNGIVPAIVGGWGRPQGGGQPTIVQVGLDGYKRHWRHLIARYGAYPVAWILGGEASDGNGPWSDLTKYVHETDPYRRLLVYHSPSDPRQAIKANNELFDFDMVGIGHDGMNTAGQTLTLIKSSLTQTPARPALCGEACYEGHMQTNFQDIQRHMFWSFVLSGAAGHTYGAAGIWHASVEGDAGHTGIHGHEYDFTTWKEGMSFPGATQVGLGKKLLEKYPWHRFESHSEWVDEGLFAAGIPGELVFVYLPKRGIYDWSGFTVRGLTPETRYATFFYDPATGRRFDKVITTNIDGTWTTPNVPSPQDWVLVLERAKD
jgi:hypothetical protein